MDSGVDPYSGCGRIVPMYTFFKLFLQHRIEFQKGFLLITLLLSQGNYNLEEMDKKAVVK